MLFRSLDTIYDKLVKNRTAQARAMGYENYLELGYYRMNRNCYGKDEVEDLYNAQSNATKAYSLFQKAWRRTIRNVGH